MIRIYLDWNVFSNFRNSNKREYEFLFNFLKENKDKILIAYSASHLSDLHRSYKKSDKGKEETWRDLELLGELTEGHCLAYNYKTKSIYPDIINPTEYFKNNFGDNDNFDLFDFDSLFDEDDEAGKALKDMWQSLMDMPSGIDMEMIKNIPQEYSLFKNYFKQTQTKNTLGSAIEDLMNLFQNPEEHSKAYKQIRTSSNEDLKINTGNKDWKDPIGYLNKHLKNSDYGKSFTELVDESISNMNKEPTSHDVFISYFLQLDMFGYYKDKKLSNLIDDASHAYSGAHTDLFVTNDENTIKKTETLYNHFNIKTDVVKSEDAVAFLRKKLLFGKEKPLLDQINILLKESIILLDSFDEELNPARIYKVEPYLISYFNRMQLSQYQDYNSLIFYKRDKNYNNFIFWKEFSFVVDELSEELKNDMNGLHKFEEKEKDEVLAEKWIGRNWNVGKYECLLQYQKSPFGLTFIINLPI